MLLIVYCLHYIENLMAYNFELKNFKNLFRFKKILNNQCQLFNKKYLYFPKLDVVLLLERVLCFFTLADGLNYSNPFKIIKGCINFYNNITRCYVLTPKYSRESLFMKINLNMKTLFISIRIVINFFIRVINRYTYKNSIGGIIFYKKSSINAACYVCPRRRNFLSQPKTFTRVGSRLKLNTFVARSMLTSVKAGTNPMRLTKETYLIFCSHFEKIPYTSLQLDPIIIGLIVNNVHHNNFYINKALQMALDVTYSRRSFDRAVVTSHFDTYFSIKNPIDKYDHTSALDHSSLFTALQARVIKEIHPSWDITVNATPPSNINIHHLSPSLQNLLLDNKTLTENRFPDVLINGVSHDFKYVSKPHLIKNQVYLMSSSEDAFASFSKHIRLLLIHIERDENLPSAFQLSM